MRDYIILLGWALSFICGVLIVAFLVSLEPSFEEKIFNREKRIEATMCRDDAVAQWRDLEDEYKWSDEGKESFKQAMKECNK